MTEQAIQIRNAGRRYGRQWAVRNLAFDAPTGTVFGLLGANGAGKSTTLRMLAGLIRPHEGHVRIAGFDPWIERDQARLAMGFTGDDIGLYPSWTVRRTLEFMQGVFPDWDTQRAAQLQNKFQLDPLKRVKHLSTGNKARLKLALVLARNPRVLLLDEPLGGLDVVIRRDVMESVIDFIPQEGRTVLIASHLVHELERISEHIGILSHGRTTFCGTLEELKTSVRRVTLTNGTQEHPFGDLEFVRRAQRWGRGWEVTITDFNDDRLEQLKQRGFAVEGVSMLSLEDIAFEMLRDDVRGEAA